nr:MAG TPA: hypothetical protein [Caudoviricetes sp.]
MTHGARGCRMRYPLSTQVSTTWVSVVCATR